MLINISDVEPALGKVSYVLGADRWSMAPVCIVNLEVSQNDTTKRNDPFIGLLYVKL